MKKALTFGFMFLFLLTGAAAQAQAPAGTFAPFVEGPPIVAGDPEAAIMPLSVGFPRWLRDSRGIQLGLCLEQAPGTAGIIEAPPCPSLTTDAAGVVIAASYYVSTVVMCDDPLECDQTPGAVPPPGELYLIEFAAGAEPDPLGVEPPEGPGLLIRLRPGAAPLSVPFSVVTPFGTFPGLDLDPGRDEVRAFPVVDPALMKFRGNGTAGLVDLFAPEVVPPAPPIAPISVGPFPGFIGNGLTAAPLIGPGGSTFQVTGSTGIAAQTNNAAVEGKLFTTPLAQAGGLLFERGSMTASARGGNGVLFASTNVGGDIRITQVAGVPQNPPLPLTVDPATGRAFLVFPMGNLGGESEVGISASVFDAAGAAGAPVAQLQDIAHVMQDTVTAAPGILRNGRLTVNAKSSVPGSARAPGARFTFESVTSMNPADPGFVATPLPGTARGGRFTATNVAPPFVRIKSSLGGSLIVPVKRTPQTNEIITFRSAVFSNARKTLAATASSSVRGTPLTFQGVDANGNVIPGMENLGPVARGGLRMANVIVPPPFIKASSAGASMTVPVQIR